MIMFIGAVLVVTNFIIYKYTGFTGCGLFTLGFAVAWLSVFCLALFGGGDSIDWHKIINDKS